MDKRKCMVNSQISHHYSERSVSNFLHFFMYVCSVWEVLLCTWGLEDNIGTFQLGLSLAWNFSKYVKLVTRKFQQ